MGSLTLVLLNLDRPCFCKQCRSRSGGRSQLIWICTVCHSVYDFMSTIWIKLPDWLKIRSGCRILIYSAWQGFVCNLVHSLRREKPTDMDLHCLPFKYMMSTIWIKLPDWLKIRSGCHILIHSAWQGFVCNLVHSTNYHLSMLCTTYMYYATLESSLSADDWCKLAIWLINRMISWIFFSDVIRAK